MFNIAPYLAKVNDICTCQLSKSSTNSMLFFKNQYVRALHVYDEPFEVPYSHTQFGVVLMVDVVGKYMNLK